MDIKTSEIPKALAMTIADVIYREANAFYAEPENVKAFEEWLKAKQE